MRAQLAFLAAAMLTGAQPASAVEVTVSAAQITQFKNAGIDQQVDGLICRGGIAMVAQVDIFGGLSGLTLTGPNNQVSFVTDRGNFVSGHLAYDDDDRLFLFDQRLFVGVGREIFPGARLEVSGAYLFDRRLFQADNFTGSRSDGFAIEPGFLGTVQLSFVR